MGTERPHGKKRKILKGVPAAEAWLFKNKGALAAVRQGLKEAAEGKLLKLKSFAKYANDEID